MNDIKDFLKVGEKYIVFDFRYQTVMRVKVGKIYKTKYNFCIQCVNELDGIIIHNYLEFACFAMAENYIYDLTTCFVENDVYLTKKILKKRFKETYGSGYYRWVGRYKNMLAELKTL